MKIGGSFDTREGRDVDRMRHACDIVGPDAALFVDANGAYTAKQAVRFMWKVRELDISWLEEPVSSDNLARLCLEVWRHQRWLRITTLAAACNLEISGDCAPHMSVHAAAATPNFRHLEWFHDHVRIENMFFEGCLNPQCGMLRPSTKPGNRLAIRTGALEKYRVA